MFLSRLSLFSLLYIFSFVSGLSSTLCELRLIKEDEQNILSAEGRRIYYSKQTSETNSQ